MESALVLASPPDVQTANNAFHGSSISGRRKENRLLFAAGIVAQALHEQTLIAGVEPHRKIIEHQQTGVPDPGKRPECR